jgi:hypothetical protein
VALMQYMEATRTSLGQLQQQLEPLLAAEQQQHADTLDLPVPTPAMDPQARTAALVEAVAQARQQDGHASSSSQVQHGRPSLARLLGNVKLCVETLAGMAREEGFKQVAWGQLELWYCHDTAKHRQIIRGRVILDEPVEVRPAGWQKKGESLLLWLNWCRGVLAGRKGCALWRHSSTVLWFWGC